MAKKLYHIKIDEIKQFISLNYPKINTYVKDSHKFELTKSFGRAYYDIAINDFISQYKIDKDTLYAIKVLNILKSTQFIFELYSSLSLERFENINNISTMDENSKKDYKKSIFYSFVYFLFTDINENKQTISKRLFLEYFLHHLSGISKSTPIFLDYKKLTLGILKYKNITIKESYKIDENNIAVFKLLINDEEKFVSKGRSIKTLRKKVYKKAFLYFLDNFS